MPAVFLSQLPSLLSQLHSKLLATAPATTERSTTRTIGPRVWAQGARMRIVGRGYKAGRFTYVLSHVSKGDSGIGCILRFLEVITADLVCPAGGLALKRRCRRM